MNDPRVHDIFLRALAVPTKKKEKHKGGGKRKRRTRASNDPKWPKHALVFDTESRITADQSLTFGVYRLCTLVADNYTITEEGIFYDDDLPAKDRKVLEAYMRTAIPDLASFPPRFPLHPHSEFIKKIFYPAMKRDGAMVVGFNLPYDLTRCAVDWSKGGKGGSDKRKWSLEMSQYPNGVENKNYRRVIIEPLDSKKAFINLAPEWIPKGREKEWKHEPHFLDLRTLLWALYNKSFSLKNACENKEGPFKGQNLPQKQDDGATGEVTPKEIEYARQDVRCTQALLNALKQEFDKHPIPLKPWNAYSPASVAKSYLETMGIIPPAEKFAVSNEVLGIAMQSYYGGRSETRIRNAEVPVVPVDFTSQYPTCCALLGLFDIVKAKSVGFEDETENVRSLLKQITLGGCFTPDIWDSFRFFALVEPDGDILPVRGVYNEVTQNIGNNYLHPNPSDPQPQWFAGPDLVASSLLTGNVPHIVRAVRMVPHGKQAGMNSVSLRGMVEIDPYKHDLFRKIIEQRKLHKADKALYYWLKILANSIYGFFVELIPKLQSENVPVNVFSGEAKFPDVSDVIEDPGHWFFPPLASLITSGGRLLLAMAEACVEEKRGTYLFCDTDSCAIVASKSGGPLHTPGADVRRILPWDEVQSIVDKFSDLNPYDRKIVKGSILNLVDANFVDSDPKKPQRQLYGYSIAAKRYALYEKTGQKDIKIIDPKAHGVGFLYPPKDSPKDWKEDVPQWIYEMWDYIVRGAIKLKRKALSWLNRPQMMRLTITTHNVLEMLGEWELARPYNFLFIPMVDPLFGTGPSKHLSEKFLPVTRFSSEQERWFDLECVNVHTGEVYQMVDCNEDNENIPDNYIFPKNFKRLLVEYQEHPESKSLAPDGTPCEADTSGLLQRAHVIAGEFRYVGKETDRKWEEGDDISVLEFKATEFGRGKKVIAETAIADEIRTIGIRKTMGLTKMSQHTIEKLLRGEAVKRKTHEHVLKAIHVYKSTMKNEQ